MSFAEDYRSAAVREITVAFPGASVEQLGPDLAAVTLNGSSLDDLAHAIRDTPLVFARHLSAEAERIPLAEARIDRLSAMARALADEQLAPGGPVAVQCWVSGEAATAFGSQNLYHAIAAELEAHGRQAQRSGTGSVLSACIHSTGVSLGLATRKQALSDWPGGRVRLARAKNSVSRAEFKLEELFQTAGIPLPHGGRAIDLGAAPGGCTTSGQPPDPSSGPRPSASTWPSTTCG